jgi:hypothetical protein
MFTRPADDFWLYTEHANAGQDARFMLGKSIQKCGNEHVAGDAANWIEMKLHVASLHFKVKVRVLPTNRSPRGSGRGSMAQEIDRHSNLNTGGNAVTCKSGANRTALQLAAQQRHSELETGGR